MIVGVLADGTKEVIALEDGYRESSESWASLLRGLKQRGMRAPVLATASLIYDCARILTQTHTPSIKSSTDGTIVNFFAPALYKTVVKYARFCLIWASQ